MLLLAAVALAAPPSPIDLNVVSVDILASVPGLGEAKARVWASWRAAHGPCATLDELREVPSFGRSTVHALRVAGVFCGPGTPPERDPRGAHGAPALAPVRVDPNTASVEDLTSLAGVDENLAAKIVAERISGGPFATCRALERVPGLGEATVAGLLSRCAVR